MKTLVCVLMLLAALVALAAKFWLCWVWPVSIGAGLAAAAVLALVVGFIVPSLSLLEWMRGHLVEDATAIWKRWSIRVAGLQASMLGFWLALPDDLKAMVPAHLVQWAMAVFAAAILSVAFFKQKNLAATDGGDP